MTSLIEVSKKQFHQILTPFANFLLFCIHIRFFKITMRGTEYWDGIGVKIHAWRVSIFDLQQHMFFQALSGTALGDPKHPGSTGLRNHHLLRYLH